MTAAPEGWPTPSHTRRVELRLPDSQWALIDQIVAENPYGHDRETIMSNMVLDGLALVKRKGLPGEVAPKQQRSR